MRLLSSLSPLGFAPGLNPPMQGYFSTENVCAPSCQNPEQALRLITGPRLWKQPHDFSLVTTDKSQTHAARIRKTVKQFEQLLKCLGIKDYRVSPIVRKQAIEEAEGLMKHCPLVHSTAMSRQALATAEYPMDIVGSYAFANPWDVTHPRIEEIVSAITEGLHVKISYCLAVLLSNMIIIDYRLKDFIPNKLIRDNVLFFDPGESQNRSVARYTAPTLQAVHDHVTSDCRFFDIGSSEGILSLAAVKNGARGHALDYNAMNRKRIEHNMRNNGFNPEDIGFVSMDINSPEYLRLMTTLRPNTLIINIGEHYGITDIQAVRQLLLWPFVNKIILGGYTYPSVHQGGKRIDKLLRGCNFHLSDLYVNTIQYQDRVRETTDGFLFSSYVYSKD
ncbi:MAG: hypothetical protein ABII18_13025 [bacterium]|nr:50S ribosomal protein L11 methyltransferase [bacterium]MBU1918132.1 50S ribosomal protein L11 methyltransferase [bacterium]